MNAIENMHAVRFLNIYMLLHIIYYIHLLTIIIPLAIKAVGLFAMYHGYIKYWTFFDLDCLLFQTKIFITSCWKRWKEKHKKTVILFHVLNMLTKIPRLKSFTAVFDAHKNTTVFSLFNSSWKMGSLYRTTNLP